MVEYCRTDLSPTSQFANDQFGNVWSRFANVECQLANVAKLQNTVPLLPLHAYQLFLVLLSAAESNKPLNICTQNLRHTTYSSFFHPRAIKLIPRSFIHCRAKWKSILDNGSRRDWNELTFDVGELTLYVGELVVGDTTSIHLKHTHQSAL